MSDKLPMDANTAWNDQVTDIAYRFSMNLVAQLGTRRLMDIAQRNTVRRDDYGPGEYQVRFCHTHDYCDPNPLMASAMSAALDRDVKLQDESDIKLWNRAWEVAQLEYFYLVPVLLHHPLAPMPACAQLPWRALKPDGQSNGYWHVNADWPSNVGDVATCFGPAAEGNARLIQHSVNAVPEAIAMLIAAHAKCEELQENASSPADHEDADVIASHILKTLEVLRS
jgi:hypothetical protein